MGMPYEPGYLGSSVCTDQEFALLVMLRWFMVWVYRSFESDRLTCAQRLSRDNPLLKFYDIHLPVTRKPLYLF